ncbi:cell division protein FtsQ/DivIB [Dellaglioa sp. L3N]
MSKNKFFKSRKTELTPWEALQGKKESKSKRFDFFGNPKTISDRLPKLKKYQHHALYQKMTIIIGSFLVIGLIALYFVSPLSKVRTIGISGEKTVSKQQVENASQLHVNDPLSHALFNNKSTLKAIKSDLPQVKSLTVSRKKWNDIKLSITEYDLAGYIAKDKKYYQLFLNGAIGSRVFAQPTGNYPTYSKFNQTDLLQKMVKQYRKVPAKIRNGISEIDYNPSKVNNQRIYIYMNDGNKVIANIGDFANKMAFYPSISSKLKKKNVIDLEVGAYSYPDNKKS